MNQKGNVNYITGNDYEKLQDFLFMLQETDLRNLALDIVQGIRIARTEENNAAESDTVFDESYNERLVVELLLHLDDIRKKNGELTLPEIGIQKKGDES